MFQHVFLMRNMVHEIQVKQQTTLNIQVAND